MKKLTICAMSILAVAACNHANAVTVLGTECEQIASGEHGDILARCPVTDELSNILTGTPDSMFLSVQLDADYLTDKDHIYVNVLSTPDSYCNNGTQYRVMVRDITIDWDNDNIPYYTVTYCAE